MGGTAPSTVTGAGGTGGTGGTAPSTVGKRGTLSFIAEQFSMALYTQVTFSDSAVTYDPTCQIVTVGGCTVRVCPETQTPEPASQPHVGSIVVMSPTAFGQALMEPDVAGFYRLTDVTFEGFFPGGEELSFIATGGDLPGFDVTGVFPRALSVVSPAGEQGVINANRVEGLTFTLNGGGAGDELLISGRAVSAGVDSTLACALPVAPGVATIPPEVLAPLPAAFPARVLRMSRVVTTVGEYEVTIRLIGDVANAGNTAAVSLVVN